MRESLSLVCFVSGWCSGFERFSFVFLFLSELATCMPCESLAVVLFKSIKYGALEV